MIQNRRFSLVFRICALLIGIIGVMSQIGIFKGKISFSSFMYYTIQSNLLVIVLFIMLTIKTVISLRNGTMGSSGWFTRFEMVCVVNIFVTFIVFWTLLAGSLSKEYLLSFENQAVHTITPLLCLADYILFTEARRLKYSDVYLTCIYPLFYVVFVTIAGFSGYVYYYTTSGPFSSKMEPVRFPYFFLDYDRIGKSALLYIAGISLFVIALGHGMYLIDRKIRKSKAKTDIAS